jgi:membrane protein
MALSTPREARAPRRVRFAVRLTQRAVAEYVDDRGPQLAASIAYHVLFSIFPLAIVLTGVFGLVVHLAGVEADVIGTLVRNVPLSASGEEDLRRLLEGVTSGYSALGLLGAVGLVWAASGMMAAVRVALNAAWDVEKARPFLRGKLIDVGLVVAVALGALASIVATVTVRAASDAAGSWLGVDLSSGWASWALGVVFPFATAFATVLLLYRFVPAVDVPASPTWQVAGGVALAFVALQNVFALYVRGFANYNAVYGSLGAVIACMFFVYLSASIFLLGAELASEWPRLRRAYSLGEAQQAAVVPDADGACASTGSTRFRARQVR